MAAETFKYLRGSACLVLQDHCEGNCRSRWAHCILLGNLTSVLSITSHNDDANVVSQHIFSVVALRCACT